MKENKNNEPTLNKAKAKMDNRENNEQDYSVEFSSEFRTKDPNSNNESRNKKNNRKDTEFSEELSWDKDHKYDDFNNTIPFEIDENIKDKVDHEFKEDSNFYNKKTNNKENKLF